MLDAADQKLNTLLSDVAVLVMESDKHVLTKFGLRRTRYHVLRHLYHQPGRTLGQLSDLTLIYKASASRVVHSMEKDGLVTRKLNQNDRRLFTVSLSAAGKAFYERVNEQLEQDIQKRFEPLDDETKANLLNLVSRLRDGLKEHRRAQDEMSGEA